MYFWNYTKEQQLQIRQMLIYLFQYIVIHIIHKAHGTETFVLGVHANQRNFEVAKKENEVIFLEENYEKNYEGFDPNSPESLIGINISARRLSRSKYSVS